MINVSPHVIKIAKDKDSYYVLRRGTSYIFMVF